jgi:serine protease AprX
MSTQSRMQPMLRAAALGVIISLIPLAAVQADDSVWARIDHSAVDPAIADFPSATGLADYGSFQWGRISATDAAALERQGVRLSATNNPFLVILGEQHFDPLIDGDRYASYQADPDGDWHLVQFEGPVRQEWLQDLRATGVKVAQPLHPFSYFVWGDSAQIASTRSLSAVRWTGAMQPDWKVQPHLREFGSEIRPTMALASAHADQTRLWSDLSRFGQVHAITPLNSHFQVVHLDVAGNLYSALAEVPGMYTVQFIRPETAQRGEMSNQSIVGNYDASNVVFPGYATWLTSTGYGGDGVIVGIVDGGIRTSHVDLVDRMSPCVPSGDSPTSCTTNNNAHGTHVAGAVAGTGASGVTDSLGFLRGQGVAPGANVVQQRYNDFLGAGPGSMIPDGMLKIYRESALSGALLTNNSWGPTGTPQGYDIPTQQIDFISRDATPELAGHQPVLAVWSIMNGNGDSGGACAPSSLGSPDEAKNLFAVGSNSLQTTSGAQESNIFRVSPNSGHGPACDGRRVPHIVAPGCRTDSTSSGSDTSFGLACGTSMASPVVSGAVAVWAEKYIDETGDDPSPALVKAVFTAAAQDLEGNPNADGVIMGHRPDRFQGYGRLDLDLVMNHGLELFTLDQTEVFTTVGQDWSIGLNAVNPAEPVRIMLAWTDAPGHGLGGSTPAWVNDLDLSVDAGGNTYLGNVIGPDGWSATGGSADDRNNLEGVFLSPAQHQGAVNVTVTAATLAGDALDPFNPTTNRQDFALACYNCIIGDPTFSISLAPMIGEACVPDEDSVDVPVTVSVGTIGVYTGSVDLSTSGEPSGVSSQFDPTSVVVPGTSDLTFSIDSTASAGSYPIQVIGDDGDDIHSREFTLNLDEYLASGPGLLTPADGASDTSLTPTFSWDGLSGAAEYQIQVATDAGFGTIVIDESVEGSSFVPSADLATGTEYFWRVRGENLCGGGEWSATFSFTTRLEPVAEFSATEFDFEVPQGGIDSAVLEISNTGTGNLTYEIATDQIVEGSWAANRDQHDPGRDEVLNLANFSIAGSGSHSDSVSGGITSRGQVIGFSFQGTVTGITGNGTWASDLVMTITAPDGVASYSVGGFNTGNPPWDFQGSGSDNDGTYASVHIGQDIFGPEGVDDLGEWQFQFGHTWNDTMNWSNVTVTLHKLTPPFCGEELTNVDWLSVNPESGSVPSGESDNVMVQVNAAGLDEGDYEGYLCVTTNAENAALVPMRVGLTVTEQQLDPPIIGVDPDSLSVSVDEGDQDSRTLEISNDGEAALNWSVNQALSGCALPAWAEVAPMSGSVPSEGSEIVTVDFDAGALAPDTYQATLCLTSNDPSAPLVEVALSMEVLSTMAVLEGTVESLGYCQDDPAPAGSALVQVQGQSGNYNASTDPSGFYQISLPADEQPVNVTISLLNHRPASFPAVGLIAGETTVVNAGLVLREPCAQIIPAEMSFTLVTGQTDEAILTVSNAAGGEDLNWNLGTGAACYDPMVDTWLDLSHSGGLIAWGNIREVTVSVDADGLDEGVYQAAICLETDDAQADELVVPVELSVLGDDVFHDRFEE